MKDLKIGISGVNPFDGNRGVGALAYSIVKILDDLGDETGIRYDLYFIINGSGLPEYCELDINGKVRRVNILPLISIFRPNHFAKLLIYNKAFSKYLKLDYILDAGYGDSYSDIYGKKNFLSHNSIKQFCALLGKKQMLLPQTVGPFFEEDVRKLAFKTLGKMQCLLTRDRYSYELVKENVPEVPSAEIIDMAFFMPYSKDTHLPRKGKINVGIGISKMLWNNRLDGVMTYKDDYRQLMKDIIEHFLAIEDVVINLIPHVVCENDSKGNDYQLCYDIWKEYANERLVLAPFFITPIQAKNYISAMDFFTGARMHACIGAFSSGVPVYPIAYSRKFTGLFNETLGYRHVGNLEKMSNEEIKTNLFDCFNERKTLMQEIQHISNTVIKEKYALMKNYLIKFLQS